MKGGLEFNHTFSSAALLAPIPFAKCLWTGDDNFYLSLDPYDEREEFISPEDGDYFKADWVRLTISDGVP